MKGLLNSKLVSRFEMTVRGALVSTKNFCMINTGVRLNSGCAAFGEQRVYQSSSLKMLLSYYDQYSCASNEDLREMSKIRQNITLMAAMSKC